MHRAVTHLPLALLFLASVVPSNGQMRREKETSDERVVTVDLGAPLTVECTLQPQQKAEWRLDGKTKPDDMKPAETATSSPDVVIARLTVPAASAKHAGVYTCAKTSPRIRVKIAGTGTVPAAASAPSTPAQDFEGDLLYYEVKGPLVLNCSTLTTTGELTWTKNGTELSKIPELKEHFTFTAENGIEKAILSVKGRSTEADFGNYTCSSGDAERAWVVKAKPHAKLPTDTNVVEGQKLKMNCKVTGLPCTKVIWLFSNDTLNETDVREVFGSRVNLTTGEQGINDTELVIEVAERSDAGFYNCTPITEIMEYAYSSKTQLRVKDMYAALWPFLGICAEVFILCAVILVYEKRRTKPELDDSDTDNHDQKKS